MKKFVCIFVLSLVPIFAMAQEITKVAVIDLEKIYSTFRTDSQAARDYEQKKTKYQAEMQKLQDEILALKNKKIEAQQKNVDSATLQKYDSIILSKTKFLEEYTKTKNDELKSIRQRLLTNDKLYSSIFNATKKVAEREGYTIVFNVQEKSSAIIWYSQTIDITDMVISELQ